MPDIRDSKKYYDKDGKEVRPELTKCYLRSKLMWRYKYDDKKTRTESTTWYDSDFTVSKLNIAMKRGGIVEAIFQDIDGPSFDTVDMTNIASVKDNTAEAIE